MTTPLSSDADAEPNFLEDILRRCAASAPTPWYPREYAKTTGIPLDELAADVECLWLEGLVRSAAQPGDAVPGVTITEAGSRTLADPAALNELRTGRLLTQGRGTIARRALREGGTPLICWLLLGINLLVFTAGILLAAKRGVLQAFLAGSGLWSVLDVLHHTGSVSADDIAAGQWWPLLTAAFVHGSLLHLIMNMSMLAFGFGIAEVMWGRARFLLIYLIAAFGGSCVAVAWHPETVTVPAPGGPIEIGMPMVGASGALCGIMASIAVWLIFNSRHLPQGAVIQLRTALITAGIFIVFTSLFPGVGGLGHLGGAIFGASAAALLDIQRWRSGFWRWLAMAGLFALPWVGIKMLEHERAISPVWHKTEQRVFEHLYQPRIATIVGETARLYNRRIVPLLNTPPRDRNASSTERVCTEITEKRSALVALAEDLNRAGPFYDPDTERDRNTACKRAEELAGKLAEAEESLSKNVNTPEQDETEERTFTRQFLSRIPVAMRKATTLYRDEVQSLLKMPPRERDKAIVDKIVPAVEKIEHELTELASALHDAGPYGNKEVEHARQIAERYATARAKLLETAANCLRTGKQWTSDNQATMQKQEDEVAALQSEWEQLVERQ